MKKGIELSANNNTTLFLTQTSADGDTVLSKYDGEKTTFECAVKASDMVMLINFYRYVKRNDIRNAFINPNGKNVDEGMDTDLAAGKSSSGSQALKSAQDALSSLRETVSKAYLELEEMEKRLADASQDVAQKEKALREAEVNNATLREKIDVLQEEIQTISG